MRHNPPLMAFTALHDNKSYLFLQEFREEFFYRLVEW